MSISNKILSQLLSKNHTSNYLIMADYYKLFGLTITRGYSKQTNKSIGIAQLYSVKSKLKGKKLFYYCKIFFSYYILFKLSTLRFMVKNKNLPLQILI